MTTPPNPTGLTPRNDLVVGTNTPQLFVQLSVDLGFPYDRVKARHVLATDSGLTANVITFDEPDSRLTFGLNAAHRIHVPLAQHLFQGQWYHTAYAIQEGTGDLSGPSAIYSFIVEHPLTPIPLAPLGSALRDYDDGTCLFTWNSSSTEPTARQTAYRVVIQTSPGGTALLDTGKVTSTDTFYLDSGALSGNLNESLQWTVILWDEDDVEGPQAAWNFFEVSTGPTVALSAPSGTITDPGVTVSWSYTPDNGRDQAYFQVVIFDVDRQVIVFNTGSVAGNATSVDIPGIVLRNGTNYQAQLSVIDASLILDATDTIDFATDWTKPDAPSVSLDESAFVDNGYVTVNWSGSEDGDFFAWRVYRNVGVTSDVWLKVSIDLPSGTTSFADYSAPPNTIVKYAVVQAKLTNDQIVESEYDESDVTTDITSDYWLIDPDPDGIKMTLFQVTDDQFADEIESQEFLLLGRGRRVELGTEGGYRGTLTVQFWDQQDGPTARDQRLMLQELKRIPEYLLLRNPFGDTWKVVPGDIDITRTAGVGLVEMADATIVYVEVY